MKNKGNKQGDSVSQITQTDKQEHTKWISS